MEDIKKLSNSELLTKFMISRENLVHYKMMYMQCTYNEQSFYANMITLETQDFNNLKDEIYRRMK